MIVAQYSVHALAGLEPDYVGKKIMSGLLALSLQPKGRLFRKGCQIGFTRTRGNHLNLCGKRRCYFIQLRLAPMNFFYYFNLKAHARLTFRTHLKNVFWSNIFVGASF
jgi:hypothetical protein